MKTKIEVHSNSRAVEENERCGNTFYCLRANLGNKPLCKSICLTCTGSFA